MLAFSASLSSIISVNEGDIIKFDKVITDTREMYNPNLGIYTIPQSGLYEVNVNLFKANGITYDDTAADLCVDDKTLTRIWNTYSTGAVRSHSSTVIINEFTFGNTLYIKAFNTGTHYGSSQSHSQFNIKYLGEASKDV